VKGLGTVAMFDPRSRRPRSKKETENANLTNGGKVDFRPYFLRGRSRLFGALCAR
jgi:hypothetical protein